MNKHHLILLFQYIIFIRIWQPDELSQWTQRCNILTLIKRWNTTSNLKAALLPPFLPSPRINSACSEIYINKIKQYVTIHVWLLSFMIICKTPLCCWLWKEFDHGHCYMVFCCMNVSQFVNIFYYWGHLLFPIWNYEHIYIFMDFINLFSVHTCLYNFRAVEYVRI